MLSKPSTTGLVISLPIRLIALVTVSLPLGAFLLCVFLSVKYDFAEATKTHCGVQNYLPSISIAIGEFAPQRHIWRTAIALHSAPRFLVAVLYGAFMAQRLPRQPTYQTLRKLNTLFNVVEVMALLGLSFVSSKENFTLHKTFFITFMACSELHMLLTFLLLQSNRKQLISSLERKAFVIKKQLMLANLFCFIVALYFYYRHNVYCEPGMYTAFAAMEYLIVLTNMAFHMASYYDFYYYKITVSEFKPSGYASVS